MRLHLPTLALAVAACAPVLASYAELPLSFEPNQGQSGPGVLYLARHGKLALGLTATGLAAPHGLRVDFANALPGARAEGLDRLPSVTNYLIGADPRQWRTRIPNFARVRYREVWPGVDAVFYGNARQIEFDFIVHPGARAAAVELVFNRDVRLDAAGDLVAGDGYVQRRPVAYQESDGKRREVAASYVLHGPRRASFELGPYDPALPLIIDPVLTYSTFLGGADADAGAGVAIDNSRNVYIAGTTEGGIPATAGSAQPAFAGTAQCVAEGDCGDVFVAKLNAAGALVWATYLGGTAHDSAAALAVDSTGAPIVAGYTYSTNFPGVAPASVAAPFHAKLSPNGDAVVWAQQIRETGAEICAITLDGSDQIYIVGGRAGAGATPNAFVQKRPANGQGPTWSVVLPEGGSWACGVAVDPLKNVYVAGVAQQAIFGTLETGVQRTFGGGASDGFLIKLNEWGGYIYRTYLGSTGEDAATAVAVDAYQFPYVAGRTDATGFFTTAGAYQRGNRGASDVFLVKLATDGSDREYSTLLGGSGADSPTGLRVDNVGTAVVAGWTASGDFPIVGPAMQNRSGGFTDGFVAKVNPGGGSLAYSTYVGGCGYEVITGLAVDPDGAAYISGSTSSANYPVVNPVQTRFGGGGGDAFVAKVTDAAGTNRVSPCAVNAASMAPGPLAPGELIAVFNPGGGPSFDSFSQAMDGRIPIELILTRVLFDGIASPMLYARDTQINAVVPYAMRDRSFARMDVEYQGVIVGTAAVEIAPAAPAVFAFAPTAGVALRRAVVLNEDLSLNSASNPAPAGSTVTTWVTGLGDTTPAGIDGLINQPPFPAQQHTVSVNAGGRAAQVTYAGAAPLLVAGTAQVNFRIDNCAAGGGEQPLELNVQAGGRAFTAPVTTLSIAAGAACN